MSTRQLSGMSWAEARPQPAPNETRPRRRWQVFVAVFLIATAVGAALVYGRDPVYRTSASVVAAKPKAVDTPSAAADPEHVAIQERLLLSEALLERLRVRLLDADAAAIADADLLRSMLSVVATPNTNLLELRAEGSDPELLQRVVNLWAESYQAFRTEKIAAATGRTTAELEDKQARLTEKIAATRNELQGFREQHDIVSLEREENRSLSGLRGLNDSLNKARERLIEAQARQESIVAAIERGETVVPSEQKAELARLRLLVRRTEDRLDRLDARYTREYIARDPDLRDLPDELEMLERELARAIKLAQITVRDEAQQEVAAAEAAVAALEQELNAQQRQVQAFTQRFQEFSALEEELARLNTLYADNRERLTQIEMRNLEQFPPIQIVEWARIPTEPAYPKYGRDLLIALAGALLTALFVTWLVDYLGERRRPQSLYLVGMRGEPRQPGQGLDLEATPERTLEDHTATPQQGGDSETHGVLSDAHGQQLLPPELDSTEIESLWSAADALTRGYCGLLLCGVAPGELFQLGRESFQGRGQSVTVPGDMPRQVPIPAAARDSIESVHLRLRNGAAHLSHDELEARLRSAADAARLAGPHSVTALSIWHSYVLYLVRQGVGFEALQGRVGPIPLEVQQALAAYAPTGDPVPDREIDWTYPTLAGPPRGGAEPSSTQPGNTMEERN